MTIRVKVVAAITGMVTLVIVAATVAWLGLDRAMDARDVELIARDAIVAAYRFESIGRSVQTSTGGYKESAAAWVAASSVFDATLFDFTAAAPRLLRDKASTEAVAEIYDKWTKIKESFADLDGLYVSLKASQARILVNSIGLEAAHAKFSSNMGSSYADAELLGTILERYRNAVLFTTNITDDLATLSALIAEDSRKAMDSAKLIGLASLGAAALAALAVSLIFGSSLGRRIGRIEGVMRAVADKDLSARALDRGSDELGRLADHVNAVLDIIRAFMERAREASLDLGSIETRLGTAVSAAGDSSGLVVSSAESATSGAAELDRDIVLSLEAVKDVSAKVVSFGELADSQAEELARISSAVEEMAASMANVARLTEDRLAVAGALRTAVSSGADESSSAAESLAVAERDLSRVTEISTMIADIADRTNMLSMNAAIESAHAGDAGKGFAVVADEIRKLSDSTAENALSIDGVVAAVALSLRAAVAAGSRSQTALAGTKTSVDAFVEALREITTAAAELSRAVSEVRDSVDSIASAARTIHGDAEIAANGSGDIAHGLETVVSSSRRLVERMDEIRSGVGGLFGLIGSLSDLAKATGKRSEDLEAMLEEFSLGE